MSGTPTDRPPSQSISADISRAVVRLLSEYTGEGRPEPSSSLSSRWSCQGTQVGDLRSGAGRPGAYRLRRLFGPLGVLGVADCPAEPLDELRCVVVVVKVYRVDALVQQNWSGL